MSTIDRCRARLASSLLAIFLLTGSAYGQIWSGDMWRGWRGERPRYATSAIKDGRIQDQALYAYVVEERGSAASRVP